MAVSKMRGRGPLCDNSDGMLALVLNPHAVQAVATLEARACSRTDRKIKVC